MESEHKDPSAWQVGQSGRGQLESTKQPKANLD